MKLTELEAALKKLLPEAAVDFDLDGQVIIYSNLKLSDQDDGESELVPIP